MYTKSGFSSMFGCCHAWNRCDKGRVCIFAKTDPETMKGCAIYRNGFGTRKPSTNRSENSNGSLELKKPVVEEQLTLF